ncbi:MAG: toxin-antitoxin system TumE family protein [Candidatus Hodarchaeales archaeon]|jgi:hypothetical protein
MIDPISYLQDCSKLIFSELQSEIIDLHINKSIYQLKITFTTGSILYIRFNEFEEYGYHLLFSKKKGDFVRWDNFDDRWPVASKPHHFHKRYDAGVSKSSMIGKPSSDIPKIIKFVKDELY